MPSFSRDPPPESSRPGLRLTRTPTNNPFKAIVTSDDLIGCPTHFHKARTVPCEGQGCEICQAGYSWRWHGYLSCVELLTNEHVLFEFTAQASEPFRAYRKKYDSLRGCLFEAQRCGRQHNSRVTIRVKPADLANRELPAAIDLIIVLCHIWNVPTPTVYLEGRMKDSPRIHVHPDGSTNGNTPPR